MYAHVFVAKAPSLQSVLFGLDVFHGNVAGTFVLFRGLPRDVLAALKSIL